MSFGVQVLNYFSSSTTNATTVFISLFNSLLLDDYTQNLVPKFKKRRSYTSFLYNSSQCSAYSNRYASIYLFPSSPHKAKPSKAKQCKTFVMEVSQFRLSACLSVSDLVSASTCLKIYFIRFERLSFSGTEGGAWGVAEPNSQFRGKYIRNNLI
jgi:hypothetical protein